MTASVNWETEVRRSVIAFMSVRKYISRLSGDLYKKHLIEINPIEVKLIKKIIKNNEPRKSFIQLPGFTFHYTTAFL